MFQGLRTVKYGVTDIEKAKRWYTEALGFEPYFDQSFYVGFNVGGYELGLDPHAKPISAGVVTYWGVADIHAAHKRLLSLGAKEHEPIQDVGENILVASLLDPFGNIIGLIKNPHFKAK